MSEWGGVGVCAEEEERAAAMSPFPSPKAWTQAAGATVAIHLVSHPLLLFKVLHCIRIQPFLSLLWRRGPV